MTTWLERYRRGERARVWHELRRLGARVREPDLREQAGLVADEMARRARQNVEDDVSGGGPYGFVLPDAGADGPFVGQTTEPFVSYLDRVFAHGGLPWTAGAEHGWWAWRRELARDLLPL